jgi:hypothetical protein
MTDRIAFKSAGAVRKRPTPVNVMGDKLIDNDALIDLVRNVAGLDEHFLNMEAVRHASMVEEDERFQAAMRIAHPDIHVGVHTEPCTDNPQPMVPVVTARSANGFDWQGD